MEDGVCVGLVYEGEVGSKKPRCVIFGTSEAVGTWFDKTVDSYKTVGKDPGDVAHHGQIERVDAERYMKDQEAFIKYLEERNIVTDHNARQVPLTRAGVEMEMEKHGLTYNKPCDRWVCMNDRCFSAEAFEHYIGKPEKYWARNDINKAMAKIKKAIAVVDNPQAERNGDEDIAGLEELRHNTLHPKGKAKEVCEAVDTAIDTPVSDETTDKDNDLSHLGDI